MLVAACTLKKVILVTYTTAMITATLCANQLVEGKVVQQRFAHNYTVCNVVSLMRFLNKETTILRPAEFLFNVRTEFIKLTVALRLSGMKAVGKTWNEVSWLAQDPGGWRFVSALCSSRSKED